MKDKNKKEDLLKKDIDPDLTGDEETTAPESLSEVTGGKKVTISEEEYRSLKEAQENAEKYWDRIVRLQSEFDNARKRMDREKSEFTRYAHADIILDLLGILDDLERTLGLARSHKEDFELFLKGVEMILSHLYDALKSRGVVMIETKDKIFDPHFHEALLSTETEDHKDGFILEELQKGYLLNDKLIRTSKVRVAKNTKNH